MNAIARKGFCPTLFSPMESGDGLLVRVRPPRGVFAAAAARTLAAAAQLHGNGVIELTNRASLQLRGLRADTVAPFATEMVAAGLAHPDPAAERRRAVIAPPLADRRAADIVRAMEDMLVREKGLAALPGKFGVLVDAGGALPTGAAAADIRVMLTASTSPMLLLDGSDVAAPCDPADIAGAVAQLAFAFAALCGWHRRMRALVAEVGAEAVFAAAGLQPSATVALPAAPIALGPLPGAFGIGLPFGATDAPTLCALAGLADAFGDGTLRMTPWRAFVIAGVTASEDLRASVAALGLIVGPDDARARISACPGMPFCASASVPTRSDAARLAQCGVTGSVHVSGCAKGCAHPAAADLTLVGDAGRYAIVRHGRAGDAPTRAGLTMSDALDLLREGIPA